jgi:spore germination protein YaaH
MPNEPHTTRFALRRPAPRAAVAALAVVIALTVSGVPTGPGRTAAASAPLSAEQLSHRLSGEVYGFLPYWRVDDETDSYLRYELLSTIALFSVGFRADGSIETDAPGYRMIVGSRAATIIDRAHAVGTRVDITFTSFGFARNDAFFNDATAQARAIADAVALMAMLGADGANLDVEGIQSDDFTGYATFVRGLGEAARASNPLARITVATNANASGARMADYALAQGADRVFIMGYNYRTSGADPVGGIAPLQRTDGGLSLTATLGLYAARGIAFDRLILGLPYYGRRWPTLSGDLHAARDTARGGGSSIYAASITPPTPAGPSPSAEPSPTPDPSASPGPSPSADPPVSTVPPVTSWIVGYDEVEATEWFAVADPVTGAWTQTYYDSPRSLSAKYALVVSDGLAGAGIWALDYDRGQVGFWEAIARSFAPPRITAVTSTPDLTKGSSVSITLSWVDGVSAATEMRLANETADFGDWQPIAATIPWELAAGADGMRTVRIQIRDGIDGRSVIASVQARIDTTGPVVSSLKLSWSASAARWITTYAAKDPSGVDVYQVRYRINGGAWQGLTMTSKTRFAIKASGRARVKVAVRARDGLGTWGAWRYLTRP